MKLIPEKRVDKNGRTVTRHVRSSSTPKAAATVPEPRLSEISPVYFPMTTRDQLALHELLKTHSSYVTGSSLYNRDMEQWRKDIVQMDPKLLTTALQVMSSNATSPAVMKSARNLLTNRILAPNVEDICLQMRLASTERYYEDSFRSYNHSWVRWVAMTHVLNVTSQNTDDDTPDESQADKCVALAHVLSAASVAGLDSTQIRSAEFKLQISEFPELVDIALSHPERAEEIAEFMIGRGSADHTLVQEWLDGDSVALSEGVL